MSYILVTGAPGSKWSGVVKNIYWSVDVDHSDYSEDRTYWSEANTPGEPQLMHFGAYWDPGMEFELEDWDTPFSGSGRRIIKSHTFAHKLPELSAHGHPIVLVYRSDAECYEWWKLAGGFSITYPSYQGYYQDLSTMWDHIVRQNADIQLFIKNNYSRCRRVQDNRQLCDQLGIRFEDNKTHQVYAEQDTQVYVYR